MAEYIEREENCRDCYHKEVCDAWVRHGKILYDDYRYSTVCCEYYVPAADVVEVTYCKNCKLRGKEDCPMAYYLELEGDYVDPMEDYDFCSYGERKEN